MKKRDSLVARTKADNFSNNITIPEEELLIETKLLGMKKQLYDLSDNSFVVRDYWQKAKEIKMSDLFDCFN